MDFGETKAKETVNGTQHFGFLVFNFLHVKGSGSVEHLESGIADIQT